MSDEDTTKELPGVPSTEPTIVTVVERLNAMQESAVDAMGKYWSASRVLTCK